MVDITKHNNPVDHPFMIDITKHNNPVGRGFSPTWALKRTNTLMLQTTTKALNSKILSA